jgi:hypothetical protein
MMLLQIRRHGVPALVALAIGLAAAVPASAQDSNPTEFPSWTIPGWVFTPGMVFGALFDSNVAIAGPDVNGNTAGDQLFQVQPFAQLEYRSPRTTFSSGYQPTVHRYFDLNQLDGTDQRAYANWRDRVTRRVTLFANESYTDVATTDQLLLNDLPFQRLGVRQNAINGGTEARLTKSLDTVVRYESSWVNFDHVEPVDPTQPLSGGFVNGVRGELTQRLTPRLSAGGTYDIRWSNLDEGTRHQMFQDGGGLVRYRLEERTLVEASTGLAHIQDRERGLTRTGLFVNGRIRYQIPRATLGAEYSRDFTPSFGFGGSTRTDDVSGYVQMPLARNRVYLQQALAWRRARPFDPLEQERRSTWLHSVLGYTVQRWLRLEGYYAFSRQDTGLPGGQVDRHLVGAQFVVSEPVRIR